MFVSYVGFTSDIGCYAKIENCGMGSSLGNLELVSHTQYISLKATIVQFRIRRGHWIEAPTTLLFSQGEPRPRVKYSQIPADGA